MVKRRFKEKELKKGGKSRNISKDEKQNCKLKGMREGEERG